MLSTGKRVWLLNVIAQFFSAFEGGQSTHNDRTQQHARTGQSKHDVILFSWIERFSFECRKVIGFALSTRCDWLKRFAPPFHPIRSKTKANCDALACIFPRFASATCNYFEF